MTRFILTHALALLFGVAVIGVAYALLSLAGTFGFLLVVACGVAPVAVKAFRYAGRKS